MWRHVALERADVSEELIVNVVPSSLILFTLMMEAISSFESSVLKSAIRRHIPEDGILQTGGGFK
jgi:hypothetical protein